MRKYKNWLILAFFLLCCIGTGLYYYFFIYKDDVTPPVITAAEEELQVSVNATDEELLAGISAMDDRDGDVTDTLVVESVANVTEENTVTVTYAAFDQAGNVSKTVRTAKYTDYKEPVFSLSKALVFQEDMASDILSYVSARDVVDGNIGNNVKGTLVSDTRTLSYAGLHQVEFRVTNSLGDTARITLPVDVYPAGSYNATVGLTNYLVYLKKGDDFIPESYLKSFTAGAKEYTFLDEEGNLIEGIHAGDMYWNYKKVGQTIVGETAADEDAEGTGAQDGTEDTAEGEDGAEGEDTDDAEADTADGTENEDGTENADDDSADIWDRFGLNQDEPDMVLNVNRSIDVTEEMEEEYTVIHIEMDSDVNTRVPGLYSVTYSLMLNEHYVGYSRLNVVVED